MGFTSDLARVDMDEWIRTDLWSKVLGRSWAQLTSFFKSNKISF